MTAHGQAMTGPADAGPGRAAELRQNLAAVRARIGAACASVGRDPAEITLIAVTKTFPASDIWLLSRLSVRDVGENRAQEAAAKAASCQELALTWHFVGQLQVNKCASVVGYADVIHSVDRLRLVEALARRASGRAGDRGPGITCLIQVSLDGHPGRGGARPACVPVLAEAIAEKDRLLLGGVMAVAPPGVPAATSFARLREIAGELRASHPAATMISAGMSGDLEQAIACGATHVRIGTALLGGRRAFVR